MKALVIGGSLFFGKHLVQALLQDGVRVTLLNRGTRDDGFANQVERIKCDRGNAELLAAVCKGHQWDCVFDQVCYDANQAEQACQIFNDKTPRYIFTSSQSVYKMDKDLQESDFAANEYQFPRRVTAAEDYGEAKRQAEAQFCRDGKFSFAAVRFPIVLGEDDYTRRLHFHIEHIRDGLPIYFPNLRAQISFIQAREAGQFLSFLARSSFTGAVNASAPNAIALAQMVKWIEEHTGSVARMAESTAKGDHSPFGIENDWYMRTEQMRKLGFTSEDLHQWLPALVKKITGLKS